MRAIARSHFFPALMLGWLIAGGTALGMLVVPQVQDRAGFFSSAAIDKANKLMAEIEKDFKKDLMIETYLTPPADKVEQFKKAQGADRTELFKTWARDRAKELKVNGVYLLICKDPPHLQPEVGNETQRKAFTTENRDRLGAIFLSKFREAAKTKDDAEKRKLYDQALIEGCEYVGKTMRANLGGKVGQAAPVGRSTPAARAAAPSMWSGIGGLVCMGLIVLLVVWVVIALIRAFTGAGRAGYGGGGGPGYGGAPGYGGGGGGGGGFMSGLLGGMFGAAAGSFLYDRFVRGDSGGGFGGSSAYGAGPASPGGAEPQDTDYSGGGGGDFGGDSGGDTGGGGDFGGDSGGGGGDFGGDSGGGGDFGGGSDFGGGGGDF